MSPEMSGVLSIVSLVVGTLNLIVLVPIIAKVFFSTHSKEFIPLEQFTQTQKDLKEAFGIEDEPRGFADGDLGLELGDMSPEEQDKALMAELSRKLHSGASLNDEMT